MNKYTNQSPHDRRIQDSLRFGILRRACFFSRNSTLRMFFFFLFFFLAGGGGGKIVAIPDYWGSGNRIQPAKDSSFYKQNLSGFSIMKDKNTDNIEERFVSF